MHVVFKREEALKWGEFSTHRKIVNSLERSYRRALNRWENPRTAMMQRSSKVIGKGAENEERHQNRVMVTKSIKNRQLFGLGNNQETREPGGHYCAWLSWRAFLSRYDSWQLTADGGGCRVSTGTFGWELRGFPEVKTSLWLKPFQGIWNNSSITVTSSARKT